MPIARAAAIMSVHMRVVGSVEREHARLKDARGPVLFAVDDDVPTLELICEIAADCGWVAFGFQRLADLSAALDERAPQLLILDDDLPDGRGGDLARVLRSDRRMRDVPMLVCTAAHPMRRAEIGSWAPVVSKPFDVDAIEAFLTDVRGSASRAGHDGPNEFGRTG